MPEGIGYEGYSEINRTLEDQEGAEARRIAAAKQKAQESALITKWAEKIKRARKHDQYARERWADDRRVARGETDWLVDTNLIGAIMEVLAAFLYAKNPDVSIKPSDSVGRSMLKEYRALGDTLEIMVSRLLRDARLKKTAKRWVRGAMTVGISWIKAAMQTRTERDPLMVEQINDLQDNLKSIEALNEKIADGDTDDEDATAAEIRSKIVALEAKLEREVAEGLVLDLMAPEDVVIAPDCGEVENYLAAPWIAFDLYKDRDEAREITGWSSKLLEQANTYTQRPRRGEADEGGSSKTTSTQWVDMDNAEGEAAENPEGFYRFTEIWSLRDGVIYTFVEGVQTRWARPPYAPRTGARFYPIFPLAFHPIDGERWPQSDVFQLKRLQDEYGRTRSNFAEHRRRAIPGIVFDASQVAEKSISKLASAQRQEYIPIKLVKPGLDMRTVFSPKVYNNVDQALYDTQPITNDMEKVSGAQDAVTGGIEVEKTATEAQIQESGRGARTGARLDTLEESLTELSEYVVQLMVQTMDKADAERYAGRDAVWVDMSVDEALTLLQIEIKAGSTGKPKVNSDREAWGTLMPLIEGMIDRIGQARMQGQEWAAKPWIALLKETAERLDDFADIEQFLPVPTDQVIAATTNQQPSEEEQSEARNTDADTLKKLSDALEKSPLFVKPAATDIVEEMNGQGAPQAVPTDGAAAPAPDPLSSTEITQ